MCGLLKNFEGPLTLILTAGGIDDSRNYNQVSLKMA
jgi:hypothetical protein